MQELFEKEATEFLQRGHYEKKNEGSQKEYRNGYETQKVKTSRCFVIFLSQNSLVRKLAILLIFIIIITGSAITASADFGCLGSYTPPPWGGFALGGSAWIDYAPGSDCSSQGVVLYTFPGDYNDVYTLGVCEGIDAEWCVNGCDESCWNSWCDSVATDTVNNAYYGTMKKIDSFKTNCILSLSPFWAMLTYNYYVYKVSFCEDKDGDEYTTCDNDCDDNDPDVYPGAKEICDGKDNDCNGKIDDLCPGLSVPLYKQCASPWGTDIYDHITSTICRKGCALTSAVMVLRYYGVTTGADGKEVNPRNLNEWLKSQPKGYVGRGSIDWREVAGYSGGRISYSGSIDGRSDKVLNDDLCDGKPVILNVPNHFVVATGSMCSGDETTWSINDPGRSITTLQGYGNTYLGLRRFK